MKKLFSIAILFFATTTFLVAQSNKEEVDFYQSIFGAEKKVMVANLLQLENDDAFWVLYDEYETKRKELGKARIEILNNYAENYIAITDEEAGVVIERAMKMNKDLNKLISKYYKKIKKDSGAKVAAQFYHVENYLLSAIRVAILESIPVIGALHL